MNQNQETIEADLKGLLEGEVRCDDLFVQIYASDASIYEVKPLGVVRPRHAGDVIACVQYAAENQLPIHARGAGSGLAGESLGRGLIVDFSQYMRRLVSVDGDTARVQPGLTLAQLNSQLEPYGRIFGPDPANQDVTTMGSVLAIDAAGSHWLKYGSAREHVVSMNVVLPDGTRAELGRQSLTEPVLTEAGPRVREIATGLSRILSRDAEQIVARTPRTCVNRCGYQLKGVLEDGQLHFPRLLVGSEGTLAITLEATVRTQPLSAHHAVALLLFDRLDSAARAGIETGGMGATACDLMDRRLLTLARERNVHFDLLIPEGTEAVLLVETQGDDPGEVHEQLDRIVDRFRRRRKMAFGARIASDALEYDLYWQLARQVVPTLYRLTGTSRPLPFIEDVAVPPETLPDFLVKLQNVLKKHQVTASLFAHAGHGQLHVRPFLDLANPNHTRRLHALASDFYEEVWKTGGTISGEHGDGLSRSSFVAQQYGPLYRTFWDVKRLFDPLGVFNPGKIVGNDPHLLTSDLRPVIKSVDPVATEISPDGSQPEKRDDVTLTPVALQLTWSDEELAHTARSCNGCGICRTQSAQTRMCPIFRFAPREEASPRAKANLMRAISTGNLDRAELQGDELKGIADLCFNCHQCRLECPASVDIPKLMIECKVQYVATNGLRPSDAFFTRLESFSTLGSMIRPVANWAFANRQMRWLMEKTFGLAQGRKLPRFSKGAFLRRAARRKLTRSTRRSGAKVLYFVDVYANWYDAQLAEAFVAILQHNGVAVYVHPDQRQSGMSMISMGALDKAKEVAGHNIKLLAEAVRQGYQIVATEPAAALCLTHEYLNLFSDDDSQLVAENSHEACGYLWNLHQNGNLRLDLNPVNTSVGYHMPCHLKALGTGSPGPNLLGLIPSLNVQIIEKGCSGMAGTFGFKRENYRSSLRVGWGLISALRAPGMQLGATECSSCKIQMEQGTTKPTIHPLKLLALSYGLMPEISNLLNKRGEELIVT